MEDRQGQQRPLIDYPEQEPLLLVSTPPTTTATATEHSPSISTSRSSANMEQAHDEETLHWWKPVLLLICAFIWASFISYLTRPILHPPQFEVDAITIYPFNISSSHPTTNWFVTFSVTNPNPVFLLSCDDVVASVFYKNVTISSKKIEPFSLYYNGRTLLQANIGVSYKYINSSIADAIVADWSAGAVNFTVIVNAATGIDYETTSMLTIVSCEEINIGFSADMKIAGTMVDFPKECKSRFVF